MFACQFPPIILEFLTNKEIAELSLVCQDLTQEMWPILQKCKKKISDEVVAYFNTNRLTLISTHRSYHPQFEKNIKRLFYFIPELFEYIQTNHVEYLDLSDPFRYQHTFHHLVSMEPSYLKKIVSQILHYIKRNRTLTYCNIGMFQNYIDRTEVEWAVLHHPTLRHIEIASTFSLFIPSAPPNSMYRLSNNTFEWQHHPPRL
jgi:hypothetical protein